MPCVMCVCSLSEVLGIGRKTGCVEIIKNLCFRNGIVLIKTKPHKHEFQIFDETRMT